MLFNAIIAASILAYTSVALPQGAPSSAAAAAPPAPTGPSLTTQLFLADSAVDRFNLLPKNEDFVFPFVDKIAAVGGKGGDLVAANRKTFPALVGTNSGMAVGFLDACGFNTPHVHPRATELQIVIEGKVVTEMLPENGVNGPDGKRRVIRNTLSKFQMQPFYQGSVHTQFNPDCEPATFIASFNAEDFGAGQIPEELFAMSPDIVTAAFGQAMNGKDVDRFKNAIPATIALGVKECLKKCYNDNGTLKDPKGNNKPKSTRL